eukprot:CAMPEP_0183346700 /NCGR_PEP_ID=MMETSP0164_2-20130417/11736_1 /TAXON_ID=221442 /ORGANISM="Coccolithus pelagicus ssp braarudi, Strain PLY182g" /LENGTH=128 /DNA_ID=CAMNT_0025518015 /DNA_START=450 /DNA_END=837 /DNA_ORIENTATION=-
MMGRCWADRSRSAGRRARAWLAAAVVCRIDRWLSGSPLAVPVPPTNAAGAAPRASAKAGLTEAVSGEDGDAVAHRQADEAEGWLNEEALAPMRCVDLFPQSPWSEYDRAATGERIVEDLSGGISATEQ